MRILVAIGVAVAALGLPTTALADTTTVSTYGCFLQGGHVFRPANSEIVAQIGWAAKNRGLVQDFVNAQTTTFAVNGGTPVDVSGSYGEIGADPNGAVSRVRYNTGVALAPGESMTIETVTSVSHRLLDGIVFADGEAGRPLFGGPGTLFAFTCTVTGV